MADKQANRHVTYVVLVFLAVIFVFPFIWMITSSLKSNVEALASPSSLLPETFNWNNYRSIWGLMDFPRQTLNSAIMALSVTFGQIMVAALAGYSFARLYFLGRDWLLVLFLATLIVPFEILFIPLFIMLSGWGWTDTFAALIIPSLANPFAIFVFRQFFLTVPRDLEEAMRVDGAGYYRIFWSLMLPLSGPAIATVFILTFLAEWSALLKPLVFTTSENMRTLQVGLSFLDRGAFVSEPKVAWLMAGVVLVSIPPIIVFLLMQERFVKSIASTGLKG
jgi:multiple sugar transport system permease protein